MTVPQQTPVSNCWGNNSATEFSFNFYIAKESELLVEHTDLNGIKSTLENGVDYSIHQVGNTEGSYITFPLTGSKYKTLAWDTSTDKKELLTLSLTLPIQQIAEYKDSGDLSKHNLELSFDYAIRLIQILNRTISRAVKVSEGDKVTPDQLIESLNESKRIAVDAANSAKSQAEYAQNSANVAKDKADIATQKATEATDIVNNSLTSIENKTQEELNKIHATGIDTKLNKTQLTNCILEAPQRIKWEVIDGVFYIKAGSILTRPNGWLDKEQGIRKFEYKTLDTNIALSQITSTKTVNVILFFVGAKQSGNDGLWYFSNDINVFSQDTSPVTSLTNCMWYDTDNNIIKHTTDSGKTWIDEEIYFPIGLVSLRNGVLDSVVDIFNGSGFIGSCGWVDRGVKCLFSNGRNDNGSLKNVENSTSEISISNPTGYKNAVSHMLLELNQDNSLTLGWLLHVYEGYVLPPIVSSDNEYFYHKTENIWYYHAVGETKWKISDKQNIILRKCWFNENRLICTSTINTPVSLAKEQDIDGKWVQKDFVVGDNVNLNGSNITYDLSDYLPNDGDTYEIIVSAICDTTNTNGAYAPVYLRTDILTNQFCVCRARTRTTSTMVGGGGMTIIVGSSRKLYLDRTTSYAGTAQIVLKAYRKVR